LAQTACARHLIDLVRAHPGHAGAPHALATLETYRARGAEARKQADLKAAQAREREWAAKQAREREWAAKVTAPSSSLRAIIEDAGK
jgi:hypothetical protein